MRPRNEVAPTPHHPGLFLALAPMDGVTDAVYRELMTELEAGQSGISLCVSEFIRVTAEPVVGRVLVRHCPELRHGGRTRAGVPVFVQLLGGDPEPMAKTAEEAVARNALGIDLNFGCPAKRVNQHDGGASLLRAPRRIERVVRAVRDALPAAIPVSAKIRIGWEDASAVCALAGAAEQGGADWLVVHARTRVQMYKPPVDWAAIGRAREAVSIPVVANGDLDSPTAFDACAAQSGCSAFMVGRAALAYPALFRSARAWASRDELSLSALALLLFRYLDRLAEDGCAERAALGRLKQWLGLARQCRGDVLPWFDDIKRTKSLRDAVERLGTLASFAGGCHHASSLRADSRICVE